MERLVMALLLIFATAACTSHSSTVFVASAFEIMSSSSSTRHHHHQHHHKQQPCFALFPRRSSNIVSTVPNGRFEIRCNKRRPAGRSALLAAANNNDDSSPPKTLGRKEGVYTRPSAAIERGSGFFVPGLEGAKVRLAVGSVLLLLAAVNHVLSSSSTSENVAGNTLAEGLAVAYSLLVLVQAAIEYTKDDLALKGLSSSSSTEGGASSSPSATSSSYQQQWLIPVEKASEWKSQIEWSAQSYLSLTPATHIMVIGPGKVVYWLGKTDKDIANDEAESEACQSALELLAKSTSGRLSLPSTHPIAAALVPETHERSVILQRISTESNLGMLVSSNQLLASFTPQDLTWLGQLARAMNPLVY